MWRVPEPYLQEAQDDATILAIRDMERAGIDIITDGEMRRESYSNHFATALDGVDNDNAGRDRQPGGPRNPRAARVGQIRGGARSKCATCSSCAPTPTADREDHPAGPVHHGAAGEERVLPRPGSMAMDFAAPVNAEVLDLAAAGADVIQLDEPWLRNDPEAAKRFAVKAINRALEGVTVPTVVHLCFGYRAVVKHHKPLGYFFLPELANTIAHQISIEAAQPKLDLGVLDALSGKTIVLGVLDLGGDCGWGRPSEIAKEDPRPWNTLPAERLVPAPDCGMKYLARETAFGKLQALAAGAALVRRELS